MKKTLKKYFIPHAGNRHRPHLLRDEAVLFVIGGLLVAELCFLFGSSAFVRSSFLASILPAVLTEETNASRAASGASALAYNPILEKAATMKAHDMAEKGYFAHTSPAGVTPWHWLDEAGYQFETAGENLAVNYFDSKDVAEAWMNSPTHRANILNPAFSEIGIGFAEGTYEGKSTVFVAEFFGTPAPVESTPVAATPIVDIPKGDNMPSPVSQAPVSAPADPEPVAVPVIALAESQPASAVSMLPPVTASVKGAVVRRAIASPRRTMASIIIVLITVFLAALGIKISVTAHAGRAQQHGLLVNGIILLVIMVSVLALNQFIGIVPSVV